MPEIAEVARVVHFLRLRLVGGKVASVHATNDENVFGNMKTLGAAVESALKGKTVVSAGSQGKYFWITLDTPPHVVMHLGMTGWVHIRGDKTAYTNYYKKMKDPEQEQWPPRYWKFHLKTEGSSPVELAFTDARRFSRVRVIDCPGQDIRKHSPLLENGPDPVVDVDRFTEDYLRGKMRARHISMKAFLLDQTMISGIGNWVADETLYQAKLHPEQYCDEFSDAEVKTLYDSIRYVCQTAVDKLGDSDEFPDHWLFNYRWSKGNKKAPKQLPNGDELEFITVGGRTSCYAPSVQKKTGRVQTGARSERLEGTTNGETIPSELSRKGPTAKRPRKAPPKAKAKKGEKEEKEEVDDVDESPSQMSKRAKVVKEPSMEGEPAVLKAGDQPPVAGRRRSRRLK